MNAQLRLAWSLLRPRWGLALGALFFALCSAATNAGMALLVGSLAEWMFDGGGSLRRMTESWWIPGLPDGLRVVIGIALVTVARIIGTLGAAYVTARLGTEIVHELRTGLYERTAANAIPRELAHHRGELVSRLRYDVGVIENTITYSVTGIAHTAFSTLLVGSLILSIDPLVGAACLVGAPLAALVVRAANRRYYRLYEKLRADAALLHGRIEEIVDVGDVVRSLGAERRMSQRFAALSERVSAMSLSLAWNAAITKPVISVAATLGVAALVVHWNFGAAPPPADQAALLAGAAILIRPIHAVSQWYESLAATRTSLSRVNEILAAPPLDPACDNPTRRGRAELLEADALAFAYGDREVLSEVGFRLARGEMVALVGASGHGKTTLLRLTAGLLEPTRGSLRIDGKPASSMGMRAWRFHFGWVPQEARLLMDTIAENLRLARAQATTGELLNALEAAGLGRDVLATFPAGLDTVINDDGSPLSVGQRQRLCIARALVAEAPVLILDEPTAALDERQAEELHDTLDRLRERVAVLIATHRLSSVRRSDRVIMLEHGRVVECGQPSELLARGARFRRLFAQDLVEPTARSAS